MVLKLHELVPRRVCETLEIFLVTGTPLIVGADEKKLTTMVKRGRGVPDRYFTEVVVLCVHPIDARKKAQVRRRLKRYLGDASLTFAAIPRRPCTCIHSSGNCTSVRDVKVDPNACTQKAPREVPSPSPSALTSPQQIVRRTRSCPSQLLEVQPRQSSPTSPGGSRGRCDQPVLLG